MTQHEVVSTGGVLAGHTVEQVRAAVRKLFPNAKEAQVDQFGAGARFVVLRVAEIATAERITTALRAAGADVSVTSAFAGVELAPVDQPAPAPAVPAPPSRPMTPSGAPVAFRPPSAPVPPPAAPVPAPTNAKKSEVPWTWAIGAWVFFAVLVINGLSGLLSLNPGSLLYLLAGAIVLPPLRTWLSRKAGFNINHKAVAGVALVVAFFAISISNNIDNGRRAEAQKAAAAAAAKRAAEGAAQLKIQREAEFKQKRDEILSKVGKAVDEQRWRDAVVLSSPYLSTSDPVLMSLYAQASGEQGKIDSEARAKQQASEQQARKKDERRKLVEKQFSGWDGSHDGLTRYIKEHMNDPDSYEHIETKFADRGDYIVVITKFRGANAFGGKVINSVTAKVDFNGNVIQIIE